MSTIADLESHKNECWKAHGKNWMKWIGHLAGKAQAYGLEIGTFKGESAECFLENIFTHPTSRYYCIDPFTGSVEHAKGRIDCRTLEQETRTRLERFPNKEIIVHRSNPGLYKVFESVGQNFFDFIYIDGAHDAANVFRDSAVAFDMLKVGGRMVWDDYHWTVMDGELNRPKIAIDCFSTCYEEKIKMLAAGWQVCIEKTDA